MRRYALLILLGTLIGLLLGPAVSGAYLSVSDWVDTVGQGNLPPGVNYTTMVDVGVRRPGEKE